MDEGIERALRRGLRRAGREFESAKRAYRSGLEDGDGAESDRSGTDRTGADRFDLPTDADGNARIVCRRHAETRAVPVAEDGTPACFDADHPDCAGCLEDVREDRIETW
ncbi:hypothetical protein SAMN05192561_10373 [Halopenitus malekzadehii]|uniref:Uncharacterized protein n=1 Tax=Halopenitus malekzadehii TaxID=1267564 RepID=A0A1H6IKC0_9EURY|nr:hypothetical protein [Halopenitus malekzadehii]SEH49423.1 hypothetical protein SAMN05192561_10373 [Halopenitus malekzadehii]